jgi:hypothetical protein
MQRQFEIYQLGLAGKKLSVPVSLAAGEESRRSPPMEQFSVLGSQFSVLLGTGPVSQIGGRKAKTPGCRLDISFV